VDHDGARVSGRSRPVRSLDDLDRQIIIALQADGRASWTAVAAQCETSVPTVARRVQQLVADKLLKIAVLPNLGSTGPVETFFTRIGCRPGTQLDVAEQLVKREDVRWASLITGSYDIAIELVVNSPARYPQSILTLQEIEGVQRWYSDLLLHVYKVSHDWYRQLVTHEVPDPKVSLCSPDHLDKVDWAILDCLRDDGRAGFKTVADFVNLNESTVRRRFERMITDGCAAVFTIVPSSLLGLEAETLLWVTVEPAKLAEVAESLTRHRAVRYLGATLDGNALLCEVIAESTAGLFEFTTSTLAKLAGVVGWSASVELLTLKRGFVETPWWRDQLAEHHGTAVALKQGSVQ
jgi:DNA-binding Lrp family transcriptional regulator